MSKKPPRKSTMIPVTFPATAGDRSPELKKSRIIGVREV
jgi:hypothetical protein